MFDIQPLPELQVNVPLKGNLFPFQGNGVAYALKQKRLIIGDQPGLGKTVQAIATIMASNTFPVLVICPATLKINWEREWQMWTDKQVLILSDTTKHSFEQLNKVGLADVMIVNYESLEKYFVQKITKTDRGNFKLSDVVFKPAINMFKSVIIDESHRCKDFSTRQAKFTKGVSHGKEFILALTGTPVVNKPSDLIAQLHIIDRLGDLGGVNHFRHHYCEVSNWRDHLNELNYMLNLWCFYRREKQEVLKDLPAKIRQKVICDIDTTEEYMVALADLKQYLIRYKNANDAQIARAMRGHVMVKIGILKNISARGKLSSVYEYIDDILESGEKLVVFAHLKEVIGHMKDRYRNAVCITGDVSQVERQVSIDTFQRDTNTQLCLCSIQAGGVGITLTAASRVAFVEMGWHAAIMEQCEDRCHRIGQQDSVQCTYFLGRGTIDEWIYDLIEEKRSIAGEIVGSTEEIEWKFIDSVIELLLQK